MTLNCGNSSVAELHIGTDAGPDPGNDMVVYSRRGKQYLEQIQCTGTNWCVCDTDDAHPPANLARWDNITLRHWVDLPAGLNIIQSKGYRFGKGGVMTALEVAVWRKECPTQVVTNNVICIPAEVIAELGLCYLEQQAALYGIMVGCIENSVVTPCNQGPDTCFSGNGAACACLPELGCLLNVADRSNPANPMGGQVLNTIVINYPYDVRVRIDWETTFLQDFVTNCDGCETGGDCVTQTYASETCYLPPVA